MRVQGEGRGASTMSASRLAFRAASRAASSFRSAGGLSQSTAATCTARAQPKCGGHSISASRFSAFRCEGKGGGASLRGELRAVEGRVLSRNSSRISALAHPGARAAYALIRNFMVSDCLYLFDSEGKRAASPTRTRERERERERERVSRRERGRACVVCLDVLLQVPILKLDPAFV